MSHEGMNLPNRLFVEGRRSEGRMSTEMLEGEVMRSVEMLDGEGRMLPQLHLGEGRMSSEDVKEDDQPEVDQHLEFRRQSKYSSIQKRNLQYVEKQLGLQGFHDWLNFLYFIMRSLNYGKGYLFEVHSS